VVEVYAGIQKVRILAVEHDPGVYELFAFYTGYHVQ